MTARRLPGRPLMLLGGLAALGGAALGALPGEAGALAGRAGLAALAVGAVAMAATRRAAPSGGAPLRVTARAAVGRAASVAVVEVDGRRFLVGEGDRSLELLAELAPAGAPPPGPGSP